LAPPHRRTRSHEPDDLDRDLSPESHRPIARISGVSHLYENRDLAVTTDYRDVFPEILARRMGLTCLASVFTGFALDEGRYLGLVV
jgi:hypothetical protein